MPFGDFKEETLYHNGCGVHYWYRRGSGSRTAFFLHGAGLDHAMFDRQVNIFDGMPTIAWDARGHGASQLMPLAKHSYADMLEDFYMILKKHSIEELILIGHGMGGAIAQEILYRQPDKVRALVLIDCPANSGFRFPQKAASALRGHIDSLKPYRAFIKNAAHRHSVKEKTAVYERTAMSRARKDVLIEAMDKTAFHPNVPKGYRLPIPSLLLVGEKSRPAGWGVGEANLRLVTIKDASHNPCLDNPQAVNYAIGKFLAGLNAIAAK